MCGDGIVDAPPEECDDGNVTPGDGCDGSCRSELVPGGGPSRTDCMEEWLIDPTPRRRPSGIPDNVLSCRDDDPTCDFGPAGDGVCTFRVALCFNVAERRLTARNAQSGCHPTNVAWVAFRAPRELDPRDPTELSNRDRLETAIMAVGGVVRTQCEPPGPTGTSCAIDADCSRPRRCRSRFLLMTPPLTASGVCTAFATVEVPVRHGRRGAAPGRSTLRVTVGATADVAERDSDTLKLLCAPAAPLEPHQRHLGEEDGSRADIPADTGDAPASLGAASGAARRSRR